VARMADRGASKSVLVGKSEREIPHGKPRRICECKIKIKLQVDG